MAEPLTEPTSETIAPGAKVMRRGHLAIGAERDAQDDAVGAGGAGGDVGGRLVGEAEGAHPVQNGLVPVDRDHGAGETRAP